MAWKEASDYIEFSPPPPPFPCRRSDYDQRFKSGACLSPKALSIINNLIESEESCEVVMSNKTKQDTGWRKMEERLRSDGQWPLKCVFPIKWIKPALLSIHLYPFATATDCPRTVIPTGESGKIHSAPTQNSGWKKFNDLYERYKPDSGEESLIKALDYRGKLSPQLNLTKSDAKRVVLYPASGDIMRGARMGVGKAIIGAKIFWCEMDSPEEAAFLVGILNASALEEAFLVSRTSGRDFSAHPWRKVGIPEFRVENKIHRAIADLTCRAEDVVENALSDTSKNWGGDSSPFIEGKNRTI